MNPTLFETRTTHAAKATITRNAATSLTVQGYLAGETRNGDTVWKKTVMRLYPGSDFGRAKRAAVIYAATLDMPTVDEVDERYNALVKEGVVLTQYLPE